jgi:hypothetical protein
MWLVLSVCNRQGLAGLVLALLPHSPECVDARIFRCTCHINGCSRAQVRYVRYPVYLEIKEWGATQMSRLEQTLNKPVVVLVVGVIAVALNVLLYFGYFLPKFSPLIAQINPIGISLPEAISNSDPESGSNSDPETGNNSDPESGSNSDPETGNNSDPESGSKSDPEAGGTSGPEASDESVPEETLKSNSDSSPASPPNPPPDSPSGSPAASPPQSPAGSPPELPPLPTPSEVQYQ